MAVALLALASPTLAQDSAGPANPFDLALSEAEIQEPLPSAAPAITNQELLERLEKTEAELAELRQGLQTPIPGDGSTTILESLQQRWSQVRDPSITTVDQQTYSAGGRGGPKPWFERLSIRGYAQFRYNTTVYEAEDSAPPQAVGDRSVGDNQHFLIRRARVILSGDVSEHMYVYLQTDFASSVPNSPDAYYFAQIRDWYADLYIDEEKVYRVRVGQSKIPYGWENLQSSSNRIPLDRSDSLNSAVRNERDLGVFYYWTPEAQQDLFKEVLDKGLKGSGNYGVFALGVYNGQGGSLMEQNDNLYVVSRFAYPFKLQSGQIVELGIQGYTGMYTVLSSSILPLGVGPAMRPWGTLETGNRGGFRDQRIAGTFVWYPQPWGFQAEWNVGEGPALNEAQTAITDRSLRGGYAMMMYKVETERAGVLFPFLRWNYYHGGYKAERNAPYAKINEWEAGVEWQFNPQMELTLDYTITNRTNTTAYPDRESYRQFDGHLIRSQFQINY